jgi:hypothetical protein
MAADERVLTAVNTARQKWQDVPHVLRALKRYFEITDEQLGVALGLTRQAVQSRLGGASKITPWELAGFAALFGIPESLFFGSPDEALRWVLDHPDDISDLRRTPIGWSLLAASA